MNLHLQQLNCLSLINLDLLKFINYYISMLYRILQDMNAELKIFGISFVISKFVAGAALCSFHMWLPAKYIQ